MDKKIVNFLKKTSLLLIEDDAKLRAKFKALLETYVEKVYEAADGHEAIELYTSQRADFVITDFKLPFMDGLEITTFIRRLDKRIPIVVISAYTEKDALIKFASMHLTQYLVKPVDFEYLNTTLELCAKELMEHNLIETKLDQSTFYSFAQKSIIKNGEHVSLTPNEIKFLELLIKNKNSLVFIDMIETEVYNNEVITDAALNNLVSKLRKKIGANAIKNIPKTGYMLVL